MANALLTPKAMETLAAQAAPPAQTNSLQNKLRGALDGEWPPQHLAGALLAELEIVQGWYDRVLPRDQWCCYHGALQAYYGALEIALDGLEEVGQLTPDTRQEALSLAREADHLLHQLEQETVLEVAS